MGLFTKKHVPTSSAAPLYTIGNRRVLLIVGLGNPGKKYDGTRHNIGFAAAEAFVTAHDEFDAWIVKKDLKCQLSTGVLGDTRVIVIKPTIYMNGSGAAVKAVQQFYKISSTHTVILHDELAIPFGHIRTRVGGNSAGHNGIKSVISHCLADFGRVRIGIHNEQADALDGKDFVLKKFARSEQAEISSLTREVDSILIEAIYRGELYPDTRNFIV